MLQALRARSAAIVGSGRRLAVSVRAATGEGAPKRASTPRRKAAAEPAKADKKEKKATTPRAPTAFNLYFKSAFAAVKAELPAEEGKKVTEVAKAVRAKWATLAAEAKAPFEKEAAEKKAVVHAKRAELLAEKKANAKPLTAYMLYANKHRAEVAAQNPGKKITEIATLLGAAWKQLSEAEQKVYRDAAAKAMEEWKAKQPKTIA
ncbi:hypothetical protein HYH03_009807 [Edaphochlamys debaryana]|uniref:HMG box domain-containing protein n=1 Tax=Edaphochlamys debaryana TaxID=47281 RepID=A0A835XX74_9CHLO|nr:hypothetical protein HYH03_009807 [Edaphochlamys debaryana]|eukprot:KAG2491851.1 hypothetical protein HYH03_009807 [Edaphochlamys debaryana]